MALVYFALAGRHVAVAVLGPTHGILFLILVASLAAGALGRYWSWRFPIAVAILGPFASVPGLELYRYGRAL